MMGLHALQQEQQLNSNEGGLCVLHAAAHDLALSAETNCSIKRAI